jgi:hypothetical protein
VLTEYRKKVERGLNGQFGIFLKGTKTNTDTRNYMLQQMKEKLNHPGLEEKLVPEWAVGCRRLTPGVNYLETLTKENVAVVYGEITSVTEKGCICDDGNEYPVDVLICATGFDTSFKPRFPVVGPDGKNLQDEWKDEAQSYLGCAAAGFPNYLIFLGPNCPIGNGPVLSAIGMFPFTFHFFTFKRWLTISILKEYQADYMLKLVDRYQTHNISTFSPRADAVKDFIDHKNNFMKGTVWADPCRSWYKSQADGPVTALWPGSALHFIEAMSEVRLEDWDIGYNGNRFAWMGNGYSQTELDNTADWAYYIREQDDGEPLSRGKRRQLLTKSGTMGPQEGVNFAGNVQASL